MRKWPRFKHGIISSWFLSAIAAVTHCTVSVTLCLYQPFPLEHVLQNLISLAPVQAMMIRNTFELLAK